jgi:hypothetical protein
MAYTKDGLFGNFSGSLSNLIVYQVHGQTRVRTMPKTKQPAAAGAKKQAQQNFTLVMKIMQAAKPFIKKGFQDVSDGRSAFHTALSVNLNALRASENPESLNWLKLSQGKRAGAKDLSMSVQDNKAIVVWGEPEPAKPFKESDQVMLLALNTTTLDVNTVLEAGRRMHKQAGIKLPDCLPGQKVLLFLAFYDLIPAKKDAKNISESQLVNP